MKTAVIRIDTLDPVLGYPVRITGDCVEAASAHIPAALAGQVAAIRDFLLGETNSSPGFQAIGRDLFQALAGGPIGAEWARVRQYWNGQGRPEGLRTILDVAATELRPLPWELMSVRLKCLFADSKNPILRGEIVPGPTPASAPTLQKWPIRALIVVGSGPNDAVMADEEVAEIQHALKELGRLIETVVLARPSREQFLEDFTTFKPHIFHFIGHGKNSPGTTNAILEFCDDAGDPAWEWTVEGIANLLNAWVPRFVFLNACRTASTTAQDMTWAVTEAFSMGGVPAVLGMQADIRGDAAAALSGPLYRALANGDSVDVALARARQAVAGAVGIDRRDWCLPLLSLTVPPEEVLPMQFPVPQQKRLAIRSIPEFEKIKDFVDRKPQRHKLCFGVDPIDFDPADPDTPYKDVLVLNGDSDVGKSSLLEYCLEGCKLRDWGLAYVNMKGGGTKDFLATLRIIRDGDPFSPSLLCRGSLDPAAFRRFNHELNHLGELLAGRAVPPAGPTLSADRGAPWPPEAYALGLEQHFTTLFGAALQESSRGKPLVVALDHLNITESDFKKVLVPYLIGPIAQRQLSPLRMILVIAEGDRRKYDLAPFTGVTESIEVPLFKRAEFVRYAREFCRYHRHPLDGDLIDLIDAMARKVVMDWKPTLLRDRLQPWV